MDSLEKLVNELRKVDSECPYVEFKHNNFDPVMIGEDICALANSAALYEKNCAYMIWGIDDKTHEIVGTKWDLQNLKKGDQELESWLRNMLSNNADFEYQTVYVNDLKVGVLTIQKAQHQSVKFSKTEYIRVGSYTKKLNDYPSIQVKLWEKLRNKDYESIVALDNLKANDIVNLVDYDKYFELTKIPFPSDLAGIIHYLCEENIALKQDNSLYSLTNLGVLLFARRLNDFPRISRKAVRVVKYASNNRLNILKDEVFYTGYASNFENIILFVEALIPAQERRDNPLREKETAYPLPVLREIIANALIHQDFSITGSGPLIEIFENRIEVTNQGTPLVDILRIVDNPPKSRNEKLASLMRRLRICEELGTGWDRVVAICEQNNLPSPKINLYNENTKVTIFSNMPFSDIPLEDKLWSLYLHACIQQLQGEYLTNSSLRNRFGLSDNNSASISRLIKEALAQKLIKPFDSNTAPRYMKYIPIWG